MTKVVEIYFVLCQETRQSWASQTGGLFPMTSHPVSPSMHLSDLCLTLWFLGMLYRSTPGSGLTQKVVVCDFKFCQGLWAKGDNHEKSRAKNIAWVWGSL